MSQKERISLEDALLQLQDIVKQLESDEVPLEKAVELYEKGIALSTLCSESLERAEQKIRIVNKEES